ncbi:polysaccharide pyruvyl transferase family protein|uniref:Polysaccharide pyruvyl transferase family protein WcaK n=1 Tax=Dendrosporobacter quercicolus TaxID=146817 RepID=A0A1G9YRM2_9FIRM|nr:polysaccharide pyruvyl transferase family protein [Dendrosporobacter quercicolus]NSL49864.1 polysaccharide pyruvyl transferase family protein [Dendrosporobacter quercicolus DSM 1736]SDN11764.1 Polysaccharide pyruvyl transferase family protein WcaK [Dendrosporobacter quercicolus]
MLYLGGFIITKSVLLLNDTEDVYHWGCYGTSRAIKDQLLAKGAANIESLPVYQVHSLPNVVKSSSAFKDKNYFTHTYSELAAKIEQCNTIVINGEGTIHDFRNAPRTLLYLAYAGKNFFGKKVYLINHSCYPNTWRSDVLDFYKAGYSSCDYVAARERRSTHIINNKLGVECVEAFDSLPLSIKNVYDQIPEGYIKKPYICISGAVNYKLDRSKIIARQLLRSFPNYRFVYLVGSKEEGINHEEPRVYDSLKSALPDLQLINATSFTEWLSVIKHSQLLVSGRFHYTIAALCFGTRAIYFRSNTPKIDSIAEDLNLPGAIMRRPPFLFELMLWRRLKQIKIIPWPNQLEMLCQKAVKNFNWEI